MDAVIEEAQRFWHSLQVGTPEREVWLTNTGKLLPPSRCDKYKRAEPIGVYTCEIPLSDLIDDVLHVWGGMHDKSA